MTTPITSTQQAKPTGKSGITPEMFMRLADMKPGESIIAMIYGTAKSGKTWFMGGNRTLFLSNGNGAVTLQSSLFREKRGTNPIVVDVSDPLDQDGLPMDTTGLAKIRDTIDYALTHMSDQFDTIALDDSTAFRRTALFKALEINQKRNLSKTMDAVKEYDVMFTAVQDIGLEMGIVGQFFIKLMDTCRKNKKHLIVGAHERLTFSKPKDGKGNVMMGEPPTLQMTRPGFSGQTFPDDIGGLFDCLFHSESVGSGTLNTAYRVRTSGGEDLVAGCRWSGVFETVEIGLTFDSVIKRIKDNVFNRKAFR